MCTSEGCAHWRIPALNMDRHFYEKQSMKKAPQALGNGHRCNGNHLLFPARFSEIEYNQFKCVLRQLNETYTMKFSSDRRQKQIKVYMLKTRIFAEIFEVVNCRVVKWRPHVKKSQCSSVPFMENSNTSNINKKSKMNLCVYKNYLKLTTK